MEGSSYELDMLLMAISPTPCSLPHGGMNQQAKVQLCGSLTEFDKRSPSISAGNVEIDAVCRGKGKAG